MHGEGGQVTAESYPARHFIVAIVALHHQSLWVDPVTKDVLPSRDASDVDPLAVQVGGIQVSAVDRDALDSEVALEVAAVATSTRAVLQTERGLVTLCDLYPRVDIEEIVLDKGLHGVVVVVARVPDPLISGQHREKVIETPVPCQTVKPQ